LWITSASAIWRSIVCSGLSEVIGSWKTIAMRLPRTSRSLPSLAPTSSSPLKRIELPAGCRASG
jgi:hypothetical protein